ncbi:hypothetical protein [Oryzifoliimicrobium ureilyticus]|uniref:hypothetical protein n=1 Tax=Oryzifoliimicrobium ureilyticus TaxID=3113724 RepID=UPI0030762575
MVRVMLVTLSLLASVTTAAASSDGAWNALFAKANGACIGQSKLIVPEATAPVVFDDSVGKVAVLLRGSTGRGKAKVNLICLYDKKTGQVAIEEFRWLGK